MILAGRGALHAGERPHPAGRVVGRAARDDGGRTRALRREPALARDLRRLRLAAREARCLRRGGPRARLRCVAQPLDDRARRALSQARVVQVDSERAGTGWPRRGCRRTRGATAEGARARPATAGPTGVLLRARRLRRRDEIDDLSTVEHIDPRTLMVALDEHLPENGRSPSTPGTSWAGPRCISRSVAGRVRDGAGVPVGRPRPRHGDRRVRCASRSHHGCGARGRWAPDEPDASSIRLCASGYRSSSSSSTTPATAPRCTTSSRSASTSALARLPDVDFAAAARALGAYGATVTMRGDLRADRRVAPHVRTSHCSSTAR